MSNLLKRPNSVILLQHAEGYSQASQAEGGYCITPMCESRVYRWAQSLGVLHFNWKHWKLRNFMKL